jgi:hypothetical protein
MDTIWQICQAVGVGGAAGLTPLVGLAVVVICAAVGLGIKTDGTDWDFLTGAVAVVVSAVVLLQSIALIAIPGGMAARVSADRPRVKLLHIAVSLLLGGLAGAIVFGAENDPTWIGALFGGVSGALVAFASGDLLKGVVERLKAGEERQLRNANKDEKNQAEQDTETSRRVLAFGVDIVAIGMAVLALLLPPTGLILPIAAIVLILMRRRGQDKKHEGLRVLGG